MPKKRTLEKVKPEIKEYIINLAKLEAQCYARYVKNGIVICEDEEIYSKENYIKHPHDKAIKNILSNKQEAAILTKVLSLENTKNIEEIEEKTNKIVKCKLNEREKSYLNQYIIYFIGNKYGENEKDKIFNKINKNVEEEKSMLSDVLDQIEARGEARGEKRGIIKGERKSRRVIVLNMLKNNYSDKEIKKIIEITDSELKNIKNHVNDGSND